MRVRINERLVELAAGSTLADARAWAMPAADVLVLNGFPAPPGTALEDGDTVALIERGRIPAAEELEAVLVARHTPRIHERVRRASVGVAGLGGLGSAVGIALARLGIGRLLLVDFDVVEPSNLNRQQYFIDQLGEPKATALAATLARINPYVALETRRERIDDGNAAALFAGCDVIAECFDDPEAKAMLVRALAGRVPVVAASGLAGHGPANAIRTTRALAGVWLVGDGESAAEPGRGLMSPRVGVAAHHQANAILRLLLGEDPVCE